MGLINTLYLLVFSFIMSGAADYPCFRGLLKHLVGPLSTQLSDRRSTIVKQVRFTFLNFHNYFVKDSSFLIFVGSSNLIENISGP